MGIGLLGAVFGAACSSGEDDSGSSASNATEAQKSDLFDVNDVSILFNRNPKPFPEMTFDEKIGGRNILSAAQFDQIIAFAKTQQIQFTAGGDNRANWRIFAMRFDPCAPGINTTGPAPAVNGNKANCKVQVRLIAQPLTADGSSMQDITMHLVHNIGTLEGPDKVDIDSIRDDLEGIKAASAKAKASTAGQPLGIHPGLKALDKDVGKLVESFITKHTGKATSMAIAFMGLQSDGAEPWIFLAGALANPTNPAETDLSKTIFVPLAKTPVGGSPNLPKGTTSEKLGPFNPQPVEPAPVNLSTAPLFGQKKGDPSDIAFQIENPAKEHFFTTDCVSCHTSTSRGVIFKTPSDKTRVRVPAGITGYVSPSVMQHGQWNLRNFGWFAGQPSVSLRTVNETVEVVQLMNETHRAKSPDPAASFFGPGNDCSKVDDEVYDCFHSNADGQGGATCMTSHKCVAFPVTPASSPGPSKPGTLDKPSKDDPCDSGPDQSSLDIVEQPKTKATEATIKGDAAKCLGRGVGGFKAKDSDFEISCSGDTCTVDIPKTLDSDKTAKVSLSAADSKRLNAELSRLSKDRVFEISKGKDGPDVQITCKGTDSAPTCEASVQDHS
jgi:hypothetical protein